MTWRQTAIALGVLIVVGVVARTIPHIPNFAPLGATALFCGVYMNRRISIIAPIAMMAASDYALLYINPYGSSDFSQLYAPTSIWHNALLYVYGSLAISVVVGWLIAKERSAGLVVAGALFCSVQFFLITNAAVWIEGAYDRGINGLWQSYVAGLPFYRGTLLGDLFYTSAFFGLFELARRARRETAGEVAQPVS
ncbi:MAG: hypothetical protein GEU75_16550 [Dehalococcoidia bacterium]|nr:hypothetical protein [Dehalococcoidia bacterium]